MFALRYKFMYNLEEITHCYISTFERVVITDHNYRTNAKFYKYVLHKFILNFGRRIICNRYDNYKGGHTAHYIHKILHHISSLYLLRYHKSAYNITNSELRSHENISFEPPWVVLIVLQYFEILQYSL